MKRSVRRQASKVGPPPDTKLRPRANLRNIYDHACQVLDKLKEDHGIKTKDYPRGAGIDKTAKAWGINSAQLRKRLLFAEIYQEKELTRLLKLKSLSWAHVQKLLVVKDRSQREKFAEAAHKNSWSVHLLACEIEGWRRKLPKLALQSPTPGLERGGIATRKGGRRVTHRKLSPRSLHELIQGLTRMRRLVAAFANSDTGKVSRPISADRELCGKMLVELKNERQELETAMDKFIIQANAGVKDD